MNEIEIALEYAKTKKAARFHKSNISRRKRRSKCKSVLHSNYESDTDSSIITNLNSMHIYIPDDNDRNNQDSQSYSLPIDNVNNQVEENVSEKSVDIDNSDFTSLMHHHLIEYANLHEYTTMNRLLFSKKIVEFIRNANISKSNVEQLIALIQSGLPQPNTLPKNYAEILKLLSVEDLFIKRVVCINCKVDLETPLVKCSNCTNERLAIIFDVLQETIFTRIYDRLYETINSYQELFTKEEVDDETNDIVYNRNYKILCDSSPDPFISILLHLDGISLSESTTQSLWMLSCSIVELPPAIRTQRQNNIVLSMWTASEQPNIELWLNKCFCQLIDVKHKGIPTRAGGKIMIKVYGLIADCPAMNLALNHTSHTGYYCCWYCKIKGDHVINKRQYYYNENIPSRQAVDFASDSRKAKYFQKNINGRWGVSVVDKIIDIPLPISVVADYLHTTLLGHGKTVCHYIYNKVMIPRERTRLDKRMVMQRFPHWFQRTIRTINSTHLKAAEMRNILLYCILPMVRNSVDYNRAAHLGLFVIGIRLLHGRRIFGDATADQAHELLTTFYRDHDLFYCHKQNYVLHLHSHYSELYRNHGSLCNINTFSQEDIMGVVSSFKHGSRYWADQLAFYLSIDYSLKNFNNNDHLTSSNCNREGIFDETIVPTELIEVASEMIQTAILQRSVYVV